MSNKVSKVTLGQQWLDELELMLDEMEVKYIDLFCDIMARQGGIAETAEMFHLIEQESFKTFDKALRNWEWEDFKTIARVCDYFREEIVAKAEGRSRGSKPKDLGKKECRIILRVRRGLNGQQEKVRSLR
jgi:hypothetical protein